MPSPPLSFLTRLWFAWICFFRVLFNGVYARDVYDIKQLPPAHEKERVLPEAAPEPAPVVTVQSAPIAPAAPPIDAALQLLALLQREGRLIDFLEEDVASFADSDIGAAARIVHAGCRKALRAHVTFEAVRAEQEGARVTLPPGFNAEEVKLTGNVQGTAPYTGTLQHRGWKVTAISLPTAVGEHDARIVAQAEVEL
ncbi:MAG: DUF2760 domain-containing protein [Polyangiaceae bacterium]|nr:DUF2760 domain-containing protein [Polyangiaceae bacterium]